MAKTLGQKIIRYMESEGVSESEITSFLNFVTQKINSGALKTSSIIAAQINSLHEGYDLEVIDEDFISNENTAELNFLLKKEILESLKEAYTLNSNLDPKIYQVIKQHMDLESQTYGFEKRTPRQIIKLIHKKLTTKDIFFKGSN